MPCYCMLSDKFTYTFQHKKPSKIFKLKKLLKGKEDKADGAQTRILSISCGLLY